jgi:hypothetical protein
MYFWQYLKINSRGKVPALVDESVSVVVTRNYTIFTDEVPTETATLTDK